MWETTLMFPPDSLSPLADVVLLSLLRRPYDEAAAESSDIPPQRHNIRSACCHSNALSFLLMSCRRSTYNHLSSWLTDARNLTNPNTVSNPQMTIFSFCMLKLLFVPLSLPVKYAFVFLQCCPFERKKSFCLVYWFIFHSHLSFSPHQGLSVTKKTPASFQIKIPNCIIAKSPQIKKN